GGVRCGGGAAASASAPSIRPKTPTTRSPFISGTELISTATRAPPVETRTTSRVGGRGRAEHLASEELLCASTVLRCHDRCEVPAANVTDETLGGGIDPADHPGRVERVARDANTVESTLNVAADGEAARHGTGWNSPACRMCEVSPK